MSTLPIHSMPTMEQYNAAIARAEKAEADLATLAAELYFLESLLSNSSLQGNSSKVLYATHKAIGKARARKYPTTKDGKLRVFRDDVAKDSGCSAQTVSDMWGKLADNGLISKEVSGVYDDGGGFVGKDTFINIPKQVYVNPRGIAIVTTKHGGKRIPTCRSCGSEKLKKDIRFVCTCCGDVMNPKDVIMLSEEFLQREAQQRAQELAEMLTPAPARPCLICGVEDWVWNNERKNWDCGNWDCESHLQEAS